jgi:hypothetical protein
VPKDRFRGEICCGPGRREKFVKDIHNLSVRLIVELICFVAYNKIWATKLAVLRGEMDVFGVDIKRAHRSFFSPPWPRIGFKNWFEVGGDYLLVVYSPFIR